MVGVNARLTALVCSAGVRLGTGCGTGEDTTSTDPCDIPASALTEAGLNPESARPGTDGVDFRDWTGCTWKAADEEWFTFWLYYRSPGVSAKPRPEPASTPPSSGSRRARWPR